MTSRETTVSTTAAAVTTPITAATKATTAKQ